jgi:uncharacterized protein (TIGR02147 family)
MQTLKAIKSGHILHIAFKRKQRRNPQYSRSAFARDLGVSSAFVTNILTGKKFPPSARLPELMRILELDVNEKQSLVQQVALEKEKSPTFRKMLKVAIESTQTFSKRRKNVETIMHVHSHWSHLAVLEGLSTEVGKAGLAPLAELMGMKLSDVQASIEVLLLNNLIVPTEKSFKKNDDHLYIPSGRSRAEMRHYHTQLLEKSKNEINLKTSDEDFQRRLVQGYTMSLNPEKLEHLKNRMQELLSEIAIESTEGDCTEVYQLNLQFFPLSKRGS